MRRDSSTSCKEVLQPEPVAPYDCKHYWLFVESCRSSPPAYRHNVFVCSYCCMFKVNAFKESVHFQLLFELPTDELVQAAGRYARWLAEASVSKPSGDGLGAILSFD